MSEKIRYSSHNGSDNHNDNTKQEHDNRDTINAVHHPKVHACGVIAVVFLENSQEIFEYFPDTKLFFNAVGIHEYSVLENLS
jgi:hypothetical protein